MNGNVTKEGIQKDLDWMQRTGIGGFQNFDANLFTPVVVPTKLVFMTPEWKEAFKFTTLLADKKGLEMAIAGSPGWSVTGGPWVEPKDGMKKFVWTETTVSGGMPIELKLPAPSGVTGKYQNHMLKSESFLSGPAGTPPVFYQDAMVIAYRIRSIEGADAGVHRRGRRLRGRKRRQHRVGPRRRSGGANRGRSQPWVDWRHGFPL